MNFVRRPVLLLLTLLAAALSLGTLAACGDSGGSGGASNDPAKILSDTFTGKKQLDSGKLDVALDLRAKGSGNGTVRLSGPFQTHGAGKVPSFDFTLTLGAEGQTLEAGFVSTGTAGWVKFQGDTYKLDAKTFKQFASGYKEAGASGDKSASTSSLAAFGVDPRKWLRGAKLVGTEDVGGTKTTHISAGIAIAPLVADLNRLLGKAGSATGQKVPESLTPAQITATAKALKNVKVDVFTGEKDKTLRRLVVDFDVALAPGQTLAGMTPSGARISLGFADLNEPQTITPPANAKPFSELQTQLSGLLGALGATSGGAKSGGGTTTAPSATGSSKYLDCVTKAGQDITKVQKCAPLVGQ